MTRLKIFSISLPMNTVVLTRYFSFQSSEILLTCFQWGQGEGQSIYLAYQFYWFSSVCLRNESAKEIYCPNNEVMRLSLWSVLSVNHQRWLNGGGQMCYCISSTLWRWKVPARSSLLFSGQDIVTAGFNGSMKSGVLTASAILHRNLFKDLDTLIKETRKSMKEKKRQWNLYKTWQRILLNKFSRWSLGSDADNALSTEFYVACVCR